MKEWVKVYQKIPSGYQTLITQALEKIISGDRDTLDIKDLGDKKYRCRIGKYRIIYEKQANGTFTITKLGVRGGVYKD